MQLVLIGVFVGSLLWAKVIILKIILLFYCVEKILLIQIKFRQLIDFCFCPIIIN
jgi:hypothetical protein